jgi:glucose-6-phosphate 1-dehydrogenase
MYLVQVKHPGLEMSTAQSELDLSYGQRYQGVTIPEAYERLILDTYDSCPSIFSLCMIVLLMTQAVKHSCFELHTQF